MESWVVARRGAAGRRNTPTEGWETTDDRIRGVIDLASIYLAKAEESLAGAESELASGRYNNCANRCHYACLQAAVYALIRAEVRPPTASGQWGHEYVQGELGGRLVMRLAHG